MEFLYLLEKFRFPGLNEFMLTVTTLGEETAFLVVALIVFWCVDKKKGYYLLAVGFLGTMLNQILKLSFRVPRPWMNNPDFTILEQARESAAGYSFPSGHTTTAVGTFGCLAVVAERKWWRNACIVIAVLVGFSRMYIGVHYPSDVLAGAGTSLVLIWLLKKPTLHGSIREMKGVIAGMLTVSVLFFLFVTFWRFPADLDQHNLESGMKNAYTMIGCLTGVAIVYLVDVKWIHFPEKAVWWVQLIKIALGLGLVLAVKEGMRAPLEWILPVYPARAVRYFLIVVVAGSVWPMSFARLSKLGKK